jgi:hypothetical protein
MQEGARTDLCGGRGVTRVPTATKLERIGAANPAVVGHFSGMSDRVGRLPYEVRGTRER